MRKVQYPPENVWQGFSSGKKKGKKFHLFSVPPNLLRTTTMFDNLLNSHINFVFLLTVNHTILKMLVQRI